MNKQIISYLEGPRNFNEGVGLYEQFGFNRMLIQQFRRVGETADTMATLCEELRKIAGITEADFKNLKRKSHRPRVQEPAQVIPVKTPFETRILELAASLNLTVDDLASDDFREKLLQSEENKERVEELEQQLEEVNDELEEVRSQYIAAPETMQKTIRFREEFPFLNSPECPDELKILVSDMFAAFDLYREGHAELVKAPDDVANEEMLRVAQTVVENFLKNREIWEELDYYKQNGKVLGKAPIFETMMKKKEFRELPDIQLTQKLNNAKSSISKAKNDLEKADTDEKKMKAQEKLEKWESTRDLIQQEIDTRKNK